MVDVLGIAIAFITTMLLFSVLVTAIVLFIQQLFSRKHYGLINGMAKLGQAIALQEPGFDIAAFKTQLTSGIVIKKAEYVDFEKALQVYQSLSSTAGIKKDELQHMFKQAEEEMSTVFKKQMDKISIVIAGVIVLVMQLDAFALLNRLSLDKAFRDALVSQGQVMLTEPASTKVKPFGEIKQEVDRQFVEAHQQDYPALPALDEMLANITAENEKDTLAALHQQVMPLDFLSAGQGKQLLLAYQSTLDGSIKQAQQQAINTTMDQYRSLSKFGFAIFPDKRLAYYLSWQTLLGLFVSTVLISLGAPFWFHTLKSVVGLKDAIGVKHELKRGG